MVDISKLSKDSMIYLSDDEKKEYKNDLEELISYTKGFKNLENIDINLESKEEACNLREDKIEKSLDLDQVFLNTKYNKYSYFTIDEMEEE